MESISAITNLATSYLFQVDNKREDTLTPTLPVVRVTSTDSSNTDNDKEWELGSSWLHIDKEYLNDNSNTELGKSMYVEEKRPDFKFHHGETYDSKTRATLLEVNNSITGTLYMTHYRIVFVELKTSPNQNQFFMEIPLFNIASVLEVGCDRTDAGVTFVLEVKCKDFRVIRIGFPVCDSDTFLDLKMLKFVTEVSISKSFAFITYKSIKNSALPHLEGWSVYDFITEFQRQGVRFDSSCPWRVSTVNKSSDYSNENSMLCNTYPQLLVVPSDVSDKDLKVVAAFRARKRIPVVSYVYVNGACISRSSQPLVGLTRSRCKADENVINSLRNASNKAKELYILDCRSYTSAFANGAIGGGFENTTYYEDTKVLFLNIDNIHGIRDSYRRLFDLCRSLVYSSEGLNWMTELESTKWLDHIKSLLSAAKICADLIHDGFPVLCHCSDGWDRTPQVVSLAEILLDPYYRTKGGFAVLVEKEFLEFGHMFSLRSGMQGQNFFENDHVSPVFLQFIDCVWQLTQMFPCDFEFNANYLISILDHLFSGNVGTFLFNSDVERLANKVKNNTNSVWTTLMDPHKAMDYTNPLYTPPGPKSTSFLEPIIHPSTISIWHEYYFRHVDEKISLSKTKADVRIKEIVLEKTHLILTSKDLEAKNRKLKMKIASNKEESLRKEKDILSLSRDKEEMKKQISSLTKSLALKDRDIEKMGDKIHSLNKMLADKEKAASVHIEETDDVINISVVKNENVKNKVTK